MPKSKSYSSNDWNRNTTAGRIASIQKELYGKLSCEEYTILTEAIRILRVRGKVE